jgi:hypothetical protein
LIRINKLSRARLSEVKAGSSVPWFLARTTEEDVMVSNIKSVLVGITRESCEENERFSALPYALSLAQLAGAHLTVQAASLKLVLTHAFVSDFAAGLVVEENQRLLALADAAADRTRKEAEGGGNRRRDMHGGKLLA